LCHNNIDLEPDEFGRDLRQVLAAPLRPAILDRDIPTVDPTELAHSLHKSGHPKAHCRERGGSQEPNSRELPLLRARRERPRSRSAAEKRYELAAPESYGPRY
jgi:hypothetical protein